MVAVDAIRIGIDGACARVSMATTAKGVLRHGATPMHVHHVAHDVMILSDVDPRAMRDPATPVFTFGLPPPLNAYVYPASLYACGVDRATGRAASLRPCDLARLCDTLGKSATNVEDADAVYDVPAVPFAFAEGANYASSDGEESDEESAGAESESYDDDDDTDNANDEWDIMDEEEDVAAVA